jgi:hypothetical protein
MLQETIPDQSTEPNRQTHARTPRKAVSRTNIAQQSEIKGPHYSLVLMTDSTDSTQQRVQAPQHHKLQEQQNFVAAISAS